MSIGGIHLIDIIRNAFEMKYLVIIEASYYELRIIERTHMIKGTMLII